MLEYAALEERQVRMLFLHPLKNGQVRCSMRKIYLDKEVGKYTALSYVWGDPNETSPITIDGSVFQATTNLKAALMALARQLPSDYLALWVDAICINQADDQEKSQQVCLMGEIYQKASRTIAWLGPEGDDSKKAISSLRWLANYVFEQEFRWTTIMEVLENKADFAPFRSVLNHLDFGVDVSHQIPLGCIHALMNRPWWKRVWAVQERTLQENVLIICGANLIDWTEVTAAMVGIALKYHTATTADNYGILGSIVKDLSSHHLYREGANTESGRLSLFGAMANAQKQALQCTDPRDYVYGMLGVADDELVKGVTVDYQNSTTRTVFTEIAKLFLKKYGLDVLRYCRPDATREEHLPSWVPAWNHGSDNLEIDGTKEVEERLSRFRASAGFSRSDSVLRIGSNDTLTLSGVIIDEIVEFLEWPDRNVVLNDWFQAVAGLIAKSEIYETDEAKKEAVWRTPIANTVRLNFPDVTRPAVSDDGKFVASVLAHRVHDTADTGTRGGSEHGQPHVHREEESEFLNLRCFFPTPEEQEDGHLQKLVNNYASSMAHLVFGGWIVYVTKKGYLGFGPFALLEGDFICIFSNASLPHIITESEYEDCYELVGETYVHGLMEGEYRPEKTELVDVTLV